MLSLVLKNILLFTPLTYVNAVEMKKVRGTDKVSVSPEGDIYDFDEDDVNDVAGGVGEVPERMGKVTEASSAAEIEFAHTRAGSFLSEADEDAEEENVARARLNQFAVEVDQEEGLKMRGMDGEEEDEE